MKSLFRTCKALLNHITSKHKWTFEAYKLEFKIKHGVTKIRRHT